MQLARLWRAWYKEGHPTDCILVGVLERLPYGNGGFLMTYEHENGNPSLREIDTSGWNSEQQNRYVESAKSSPNQYPPAQTTLPAPAQREAFADRELDAISLT
jgi:hypothetical protein